jgi:hypothetical protein
MRKLLLFFCRVVFKLITFFNFAFFYSFKSTVIHLIIYFYFSESFLAPSPPFNGH